MTLLSRLSLLTVGCLSCSPSYNIKFIKVKRQYEGSVLRKKLFLHKKCLKSQNADLHNEINVTFSKINK